MNRWNKTERFHGHDSIAASILTAPVKKRFVGLGTLTVSPQENYQTYDRNGERKYFRQRDSAILEVTRDYAAAHNNWNGCIAENKQKLHKYLASLDSTAYSVSVRFKGREFAVWFPHYGPDNGVEG